MFTGGGDRTRHTSIGARTALFNVLGRARKDDEFYEEYDADGGSHPPVSENVVEALKSVRDTLHLRWNRCAVLQVDKSSVHHGKATDPVFDARWEIWDRSPVSGDRYYVRRIVRVVADPDNPAKEYEDYRAPDMTDVQFFRVQQRLLEKYNGDIDAVFDEMGEAKALAVRNQIKRDADDQIDVLTLELAQYEVPKSYAGDHFRGQRGFSG